jgi:hypothetical protein
MTYDWEKIWNLMDAWREDHPKVTLRERSEQLKQFMRLNETEEPNDTTQSKA